MKEKRPKTQNLCIELCVEKILVQNLKNNARPKPRNSMKTTRRHKSSRRLILIDERIASKREMHCLLA